MYSLLRRPNDRVRPVTTKALWRSGYCEIGLHEGTKPKSHSGQPMRTCKRNFDRDLKGTQILCECECHTELDKMYEMMELPRVLMDNPEYRTFHRTWWLPSDDPLYGIRPVAGSVDVPVVVNRTPAGALTPPVRARDYGPTPTGRKARGELEYRVKEVCDLFASGELETEYCTPKFVANYLDPAEPPSVGAIDAVFKRWVALGFAVIESKPTRFHAYTPDGWTKGLDRLKQESKRADKQKSAAQRRGERV